MPTVSNVIKNATHPIAQLIVNINPKEFESEQITLNQSHRISEEVFDTIGRELIEDYQRAMGTNTKRLKSPRAKKSKGKDSKDASYSLYTYYSFHVPVVR